MRNVTKLMLLLLCLAKAAVGQAPESLLIGPGDLLHVQVFDNAELDQHARVTDAGELPLLLGGSVKVSGQTPSDAARAIEVVLLNAHYLLRPRVMVVVEEYATQKVSILGEVKNPGAYAIQTERSILDVLSLAGGLTDIADRRVLIKRRKSGQTIPYFVSNQSGAAFDSAVQVTPGDTLLIPRAGIVYVLGDVARPGGYTMTNNSGEISVLELVARAGGTNHTAVPAHSRLIHKTEHGYVQTELPLASMQKGKSADLTLQADDIVYVPFSYVRNFAAEGSGMISSASSAAIYRF